MFPAITQYENIIIPVMLVTFFGVLAFDQRETFSEWGRALQKRIAALFARVRTAESTPEESAEACRLPEDGETTSEAAALETPLAEELSEATSEAVDPEATAEADTNDEASAPASTKEPTEEELLEQTIKVAEADTSFDDLINAHKGPATAVRIVENGDGKWTAERVPVEEKERAAKEMPAAFRPTTAPNFEAIELTEEERQRQLERMQRRAKALRRPLRRRKGFGDMPQAA